MSHDPESSNQHYQEQIDAHGAVEFRMAPQSMLHWYAMAFIGIASMIYAGIPDTIGSAFLFYPSVFLVLIALSGIGYNRLAYRYVVEQDRVWQRHGLLWQHVPHIEMEHIRSVVVNRNPIGLLLNYGTVSFASAGTRDPEVVFRRVSYPYAIKHFVRSLSESDDDDESSDAE